MMHFNPNRNDRIKGVATKVFCEVECLGVVIRL